MDFQFCPPPANAPSVTCDMAIQKLATFYGIADVAGALNQVASVSEDARPTWSQFRNENKLGFLIGILTHAPDKAARDEYAAKFYWTFGSKQLPAPDTQEEMDCLDFLYTSLAAKYSGVEVERGELVESSDPHSKVTMIEAAQQLKWQQSLGDFDEADLANLAELSVGASATTEMVKQVVKEAFSQLGPPLAHLTGYIKEKHFDVTYKGVSHTFEISTKTREDLYAAIRRKFHLEADIR
ncbi:hypothetical protein HDU81_007515 [Chytriomyces hyalinus]|nr:hypothetical protein HDU81_007515 [Chytriomyces hyalinus]